jgi:hypothetical protein
MSHVAGHDIILPVNDFARNRLSKMIPNRRRLLVSCVARGLRDRARRASEMPAYTWLRSSAALGAHKAGSETQCSTFWTIFLPVIFLLYRRFGKKSQDTAAQYRVTQSVPGTIRPR